MENELTALILANKLKARSSIIVRDSEHRVRIIGVNFTDNIKGHHLDTILKLPEITEDTKMVLRTPYWGDPWDEVDDQIEEEFQDIASRLDLEYARNLHHLRAEIGLLLPDIDPFEMSIYSKEDNVEVFKQIMGRIGDLAVYKA